MVSACATSQPYSESRSVSSPNDAYTCAAGMVNSLDYTVLDANKEAGFIKTEHRNTTSTSHVVMWGSSAADRLTITVFQNPTTSKSELRVVGKTVRIQELGIRAGSVSNTTSSDAVIADAKKILNQCAK